MSAEKIVSAIEDDNLILAKELMQKELYRTAGEHIKSKKEEVQVIASEGKKAPVTKKDDDGEGMDPVGKGDADIDNDGDSDASDRYLKKRRATIKKAMKESYGAFTEISPSQESAINQVIDKIEDECESYELDDEMTYDHSMSVFSTIKDYNSIERWANGYITGE